VVFVRTSSISNRRSKPMVERENEVGSKVPHCHILHLSNMVIRSARHLSGARVAGPDLGARHRTEVRRLTN
jgi:hypothetical protein